MHELENYDLNNHYKCTMYKEISSCKFEAQKATSWHNNVHKSKSLSNQFQSNQSRIKLIRSITCNSSNQNQEKVISKNLLK